MIDIYFPHIAGFSCSFAILAYLFKLFRIHRQIKVNCWFCNKNTKVKYKYSNSFVCPFCEQYNGFKEDGDYNCIIQEQLYNPLKVRFSQPVPNVPSRGPSKFGNGLCEACNLNQALKIRALAEFSAVSADDNDEVDKFKERLEEIYGLCQPCQATLRQTLGKQNSWLKPLLISWRLMKSKEKSMRIGLKNTKKSSLWKILYYCLLLASITLCSLSLEDYYPKELNQYKNVLVPDFSAICKYILWTALILQSCIILLFQDKILKVYNVLSYIGWILLLLVGSENETLSEEKLPLFKFLLNILNTLFTIWISSKMFPTTATLPSEKSSRKEFVSMSSSYSADSFLSNTSIASPMPTTSVAASPDLLEKNSEGQDASIEEDLDSELLSLKISTPKKINTDFSPQNLFRGSPSNKSGVLQPSKFGKHFITQSSWLAGGYWGSPGSPQRGRLTRQNMSHLEEVKPKPVFSLSRSSSQSSGFVSQLSDCTSRSPTGMQNLPTRGTPSQQSSLSEPVDRASVFSGVRNNSVTSFGSLRRQVETDPFEAQTACSASSYYSDSSQLRYRSSTRTGSCIHDSQTNLSTDNNCCIVPYSNTITSSTPSYCNLGIAFILGLSVSANLFLVILLWQNSSIFVK